MNKTEEEIYNAGWNDAIRNNAKVMRTKGKRVIDEKTLKALNNLADMVDMCNKHKIPLSIRNKTKGKGCEGFCEKCEKDILNTKPII